MQGIIVSPSARLNFLRVRCCCGDDHPPGPVHLYSAFLSVYSVLFCFICTVIYTFPWFSELIFLTYFISFGFTPLSSIRITFPLILVNNPVCFLFDCFALFAKPNPPPRSPTSTVMKNQCLDVLAAVFRNIMEQPEEAKFRKVRRSNGKFKVGVYVIHHPTPLSLSLLSLSVSSVPSFCLPPLMNDVAIGFVLAHGRPTTPHDRCCV